MGIAALVEAGVRAARVATAARAVRRAEDESAKDQARARLADLLGSGDGLPAKLAQWLAGGAEGAVYDASLRHRAAVPWQRIMPAVNAALGPAAQRLRRVEAGRAASLGQVHRATLDDGRIIAVKVPLPGIRDAVAADLRLLDLLPGAGPVKRHGIDLAAYRQRIRATLERELDYAAEAATQRTYRAALPDEDGVVVPEVIPALSCGTVLCQSWEESDPIAVAATWPLAVRRMLAERLVRHVLRQALQRGTVHADLHAGNIGFRRDGSVVIYDFGCVAAVPSATAASLRTLLTALRRGDDLVTVRGHLVAAGFDHAKLARCGDALLPALRCAFAPLLAVGPFTCADWHPATDLACILGDLRWWFRAAGPEALFLPMRAYAGLIRLVRQLDVAVDWWALLNGEVGRSVPSSSAPIAQPIAQSAAQPAAAVRLRISVVRGGETTADMTMPVAALDDVEALLGEELLKRLHERDVDPKAMVSQARTRGWVSGDLFSDDDGERRINIWLETV